MQTGLRVSQMMKIIAPSLTTCRMQSTSTSTSITQMLARYAQSRTLTVSSSKSSCWLLCCAITPR